MLPPIIGQSLTENQIHSLEHMLAGAGYSSLDVEEKFFVEAIVNRNLEMNKKYKAQVGFTNELMEIADELRAFIKRDT